MALLYALDDSRLQVNEERPGNVFVVVCLIEEDILAVACVFRCEGLQRSVVADAVLETELLPEGAAHLVAALPHHQVA